MKATRRLLLGLVTSSVVLLLPASAFAVPGNIGFGFNARGISGVDPTGAVRLTGGGAYNPATAGTPDQFVHSGGGFRCTATVTAGPLSRCLAGQGVRWDTAGLLRSFMFKCTAAETSLITATTDAHTAVLAADFYRAGDGNDESFNANMIVSDQDIDGVVPGVQNVWIQGVGCATAKTVHFSSTPEDESNKPEDESNTPAENTEQPGTSQGQADQPHGQSDQPHGQSDQPHGQSGVTHGRPTGSD